MIGNYTDIRNKDGAKHFYWIGMPVFVIRENVRNGNLLIVTRVLKNLNVLYSLNPIKCEEF